MLNQIPKIAVEIRKDSHRSIGFGLGRPHKVDTSRERFIVIAPEVISAQEEEDPSTGLVADGSGDLFSAICPTELESKSS